MKHLALVLILLSLFGITYANTPAQAASDVPPCEEIASAGAIVFYRCQPLEGGSFIANNMGFMIFEE